MSDGTIEITTDDFLDTPLSFAKQPHIYKLYSRLKLLEQALQSHGHIIECGVHKGSTFVPMLHALRFLEPMGMNRKLIGFDTFEGFPHVSPKDGEELKEEGKGKGYLNSNWDFMNELLDAHGRKLNAYNHEHKVELVKGDACETIPEFIETFPDVTIAFLIVDFDLYEPTKTALEYLLPRVVKGGIVAIDDYHAPRYPGVSKAVNEIIDVRNIELKRVYFDPWLSYWETS